MLLSPSTCNILYLSRLLKGGELCPPGSGISSEGNSQARNWIWAPWCWICPLCIAFTLFWAVLNLRASRHLCFPVLSWAEHCSPVLDCFHHLQLLFALWGVGTIPCLCCLLQAWFSWLHVLFPPALYPSCFTASWNTCIKETPPRRLTEPTRDYLPRLLVLSKTHGEPLGCVVCLFQRYLIHLFLL